MNTCRGMIQLGLLLGLTLPAQADDVTLTTYYPSPRGIYKEMRVTNNMYLATVAGSVGIGTIVPGARFVVVGETTAPNAGTCPTGYDWYDENQNNSLENDECKRTILTAQVDGSVGMGTTTPAGRLDIKGSGDTSATYGLAVRNSNDAYALAVRDDGHVGIGTINPIHQFEIVGASPQVALRQTGGAVYHIGLSGPVATPNMEFFTDALVPLLLTYSGNVGIGTTTPTFYPGFNPGLPGRLVHLVDPSRVVLQLEGGGTHGGIRVDGNGMFLGAFDAGTNMMMVAGGLPRMTLDPNGNVGIGTTTPTQPLDINGRIRVQGPTCDGAPLQPGMVLTAEDVGGGVADGTACWKFPTYQ